MIAEIGVRMGLSLGPHLRHTVLAELAEAPALVVLDNVDTPWEEDTAGAEELLAGLADIPGLALVASLRGTASPFGVGWGAQVRVPPMDHTDARDLFLAVAGGEFRQDVHLNELVSAQDGVPLAVNLLAHDSQGEPDLGGVWRRWAVWHSGLSAGEPDGYDRFDASIELSLASKRMKPSASRLLSMLGHLPDGVDAGDLGSLLPVTGDAAAATLRKVGLAHDEQGRLRTLEPIRAYVSRHHPPSSADLARLVEHYTGLAMRLGYEVGTRQGARASIRLVAEGGNLETMLNDGLRGADPLPAARAACALAEFTRYTGIGTSRLLADAAEAAGRAGGWLVRGECLYRLGDLALRQSRQSEARAHLSEALEVFESTGDTRWQAHCVKHLGDLSFEQSDFLAASEHFHRAEVLYQQVNDIHGATQCVKCLGDVALRQSRYAAAETDYRRAFDSFTQLGDDLGQADCLRRLADLDVALSRVDAAAERYHAATLIYNEAGAVLGRANCILGAARVALARGDFTGAKAGADRAEPLYARMGYVRGQAECVAVLGRLALAQGSPAAAAEHFGCALELFEKVNDVVNGAASLIGLADAASERDEVSHRATTALGLFQRTGCADGVGQAHHRLARVADEPSRRDAHLQAARSAWLGVGREDRIAELEREFDGT